MLDINIETIGDVVIMHFKGTLTRDVLKDLEDAWEDEALRSPGMIALDFKNITQIDSICINHLFKMVRMSKDKNFDLVIYDVFESLKKIFEVIKLDRIVTIMSRQQFESSYLKNP